MAAAGLVPAGRETARVRPGPEAETEPPFGAPPATRSAPGVERWLLAIEEVFAKIGVFPAHRIVQRMRAGVARMAIAVVLGERRARAGKLEKLVGCGDGDFRREDLRLGSDDLGVRDRFRIRVFNRTVDGAACLFEQRLCRMKP